MGDSELEGCNKEETSVIARQRVEVLKRELAEALEQQRTWTIPAVRFKSDRDELVMLSVPVIQLLDRIKRRQSENHGPFVFSTTDGWKPIQGVSTATEVFRKRMGEIYAEKHGKPMKHWVPAYWPCASRP